MTSPSSRPALFHHLQNGEGINEIKTPFSLCFHTDARQRLVHTSRFFFFFSLGFYGGLVGNIFLLGGFCTGLTVDAADLCNEYLSIKAPLGIFFLLFFFAGE